AAPVPLPAGATLRAAGYRPSDRFRKTARERRAQPRSEAPRSTEPPADLGAIAAKASRRLFGQEIADAAHRMNGAGRAGLGELATEMMDMDRNRIRAQFVVDAVELFLQHRLWHHPAKPPHQMFKYR